MLEQLQARWATPVGISAVSRFFHHDPVMRKPFFQHATFCIGTGWQWPAFESFLHQHASESINPANLITSLKDTTPLNSETYYLDLDRISQQLLPNLKQVILNLFVVAGTNRGTGKIAEVTGYYGNCVDCDECEFWSQDDERSLGPRTRCNRHYLPGPAAFAEPSETTEAERELEIYPFTHSFHPCDFIGAHFLFEEILKDRPGGIASTYGRMLGYKEPPSQNKTALKKRMINGHVILRCNWEMVFLNEGIDEEGSGGQEITVVSTAHPDTLISDPFEECKLLIYRLDLEILLERQRVSNPADQANVGTVSGREINGFYTTKEVHLLVSVGC